MKTDCFILLLCLTPVFLPAQEKETEISSGTEQQFEDLMEKEEAESEDDSYQQQLSYFRKHPLNLNLADADDLKKLMILSDGQIVNFMQYRKLLGRLISIYELQSIPGWEVKTIHKLLPFVVVNDIIPVNEKWRQFSKGESSLLLRYARVIEQSKGYQKHDSATTNYYLGGPGRVLVRYKYNYKDLLQAGVLGDKDAGEQFFKGAQSYGFDFYSFHLFARKLGAIKSLAIGDFSVNMGQGLIQWQSMAFKKSSSVLGIKRQSPLLRPYNSAGEFNFHRGAGLTLQRRNWELTAFISLRRLSANIIIDSLQKEKTFVSSLLPSGYHRTAGEIADQRALKLFTVGGSINYSLTNWNVGVNFVHYDFSKPFQKQKEPYNLFALSGNKLYNYSINYSYTFRNFHLFGETAFDNNTHIALLNGLLMSLDPKVDLSFVYRRLDKAYQSLFTNAFTENISPNNEEGIYAGLSMRPAYAWRLDVYMDLYSFPWLKYRVDAPGSGRDWLVQVTYTPNKNAEIYSRYKNESKSINLGNGDLPTHPVGLPNRQDWRTQINWSAGNEWSFRTRVELLWYKKQLSQNKEGGFLSWIDLFYRPFAKAFSGSIRLQYFETGSYDSRIFSYENDVLYSNTALSFHGKGFRWYLNGRVDIKDLFQLRTKFHIECCLRLSQTVAGEQKSIGTGLDEIANNSRTDIKTQLIILW